MSWNLLTNNVPSLASGGSGCGVRALNLAASRDGRNVSMILGDRAMNAVIENGALPLPPTVPHSTRYEVGSTTFEGLLRVPGLRARASHSSPCTRALRGAAAPSHAMRCGRCC